MLKSLQTNKLKILAVALVYFFFGAHTLFAQNRIVTGTVKSDDNEALPGVSVNVKGTEQSTATDSDGKFSITIPSESTVLVFSFIGTKTQEVPVNNQSIIDVTMVSDVSELKEVVVIGYGEVDKKDVTSSVSSVSSKQLKDIPINSAAQALAGRLAGVQVTASEGTPNAQVQIRVRGGGSITQDNTPLYVVDGAQVENALSFLAPQDIASIDVLKDASATAIYGARGANGVVIITTKKGFKSKPVVSYNGLVGVSELANKLQVMNPYDFVSYQYERSRGNTSAENSFRDTYGNYADIDLYKNVPFQDWQDKSFGRSAVMITHNVSVAGGTSKTKYNVSLSNNKQQGVQLGSDFDRYLVNARLDQTITKWMDLGATLRYNHTVVNGAGTSAAGSSSTNRLRQSVKYRPILFPGQSDDTYDADYVQETNSNSLSLVNPVLLSKAQYQKDIQTVMNISGTLTIKPTKYLTWRTTVGYDWYRDQVRAFNDTITNTSMQNGQGKPVASIDSTKRTILNNSNVLTFSLHNLSKAFAVNNKLDVLVGEEIYETTTTEDYNEKHGYPAFITPNYAFDNLMNNNVGTTYINPSKASRSQITNRLLSFFSRINYSYADKYLVAATFRADGSSKFAKGHQWGYFPSASVAWRISNENFFSGLASALQINDMKIRASYGQSGNNRIGDFLYITQFEQYPPYGVLDNANLIGWGQKRDNTNGNQPILANSNLKWETTTSKNLGVDFSFFENRLQLTVDVYRNSTKDLLVNTPVPTSSGYQNQLQNVGSTSNHGVEIQLSATPVQHNDFSWNTTFNISFNKNKVESLGMQKSFLFNSGWANNSPADYIVQVGQPTGTIYGLVVDGMYKVSDFQTGSTGQFLTNNGTYVLKDGVISDKTMTSIAPKPGVIKYKDVSGPNGVPDGVIDDYDRTALGSANPLFFGGFNNMFSYKHFDLSVYVNFQYGNKVLNANKLEFTSGYTTNSNLLAIMNDRFKNIDGNGNVVTDPATLQAMNVNAKLWTPLTGASSFYVNSWAVEDGSFIRINNVTLGYTFPQIHISKLRISKLRIYATGNNLHVFTKYSGYDPEVNTRRSTPITPGVDYSAYPRSHTYIFGVNASF